MIRRRQFRGGPALKGLSSAGEGPPEGSQKELTKLASSGRGATGVAVGSFITCPRCEASVRFPANYCDMCGGRVAQHAATGFLPTPAQPVGERKDQPPTTDSTLSVRQHGRSRPNTEGACRSLRSAYLLLKGSEKSLESIEASDNLERFGSALVSRIASRVRMRPEIAELHRTLDLVVSEVSKASGLDPDAVIETEDGLLNALALMSSANRVRGNIEYVSGRLRKAIHHYQSSIETSIDKRKSQDAYFDMAVAYELIGKPGMALLAYERCSRIAPDTEVGLDALYETDELRSRMIMGGWFVGSRNIVIVMGVGALSSLAIMLLNPEWGMLNLGLWGGALGLYCVAKFRRAVRPRKMGMRFKGWGRVRRGNGR
jgi:tetratricopeptide (TPR) repeat protein